MKYSSEEILTCARAIAEVVAVAVVIAAREGRRLSEPDVANEVALTLRERELDLWETLEDPDAEGAKLESPYDIQSAVAIAFGDALVVEARRDPLADFLA